MSPTLSLFVFFSDVATSFLRLFRVRMRAQNQLRNEKRVHKKLFFTAVRFQPEWGHGVATVKLFGVAAFIGATLLLSTTQPHAQKMMPVFFAIDPSSRIKTAILFGSVLFILAMKAIEAFHSARQRVRAWETPLRSTWSQSLVESCGSAEAQAFRDARKEQAQSVRRSEDAVAIERAANAGRKASRAKNGDESAARPARLGGAGVSDVQPTAPPPRKARRI